MVFLPLLLVLIVASGTLHPISFATGEISRQLPSSGMIRYPSNGSTIINGGTLANSIIGTDYLVHFNNGEPSQWTPHLTSLNRWKCKAARLGFAFSDAEQRSIGGYTHSIYNQTKMDRVVTILYSVGVKSILDLHNYVDHSNYLGSWDWVNNWKAIALHYKDDDRIAGFNIFNEPNPTTWAHSGPVGAITTKEKFHEACAYLIDEIRRIDPDRTIFYPVWQGMSMGYSENIAGATEFYNDLQTYQIPQRGNIVYDILHPYYFENEWDLYASPPFSPTQRAAFYINNFIIPAVNLYGAEHCWIGETYAGLGKTQEYQVTFVAELINACVDMGVGIQLWSGYPWNELALSQAKYGD
jgi:Cellulase (glycosyl hydrolase family 5)